MKAEAPQSVFRSWFLAAAAGVLVGCGGGGGDDSPSPAAPSALSYSAPAGFTVNTAIAPLSPSVTGTVTSYSVSPVLPAGLTLNATSGQISGTPTAITAAANYTVTATNSSGSTTTVLALAVNDVAALISYDSPAYGYSTGIASLSLTPHVTGGVPSAWSSQPQLPAGLSLDPATGVISGTPTAAAARATYQITASNSGGSSTANLSIGVSSDVVLELGHDHEITAIRMNGQRALSLDSADRAVLWNTQTGSILSSQYAACSANCGSRIELRDTTAVIRTASGFAVRSSTNGSLLANIAFAPAVGAWWQLASDGSYLAAGNDAGLTVWAPSGLVILSLPGNYSSAVAFAAPSELRIAGGAAGAVVETISLPGGAVTLSPNYLGTAQSWFLDGSRFLTAVGTSVRVYTSGAALEDLVALPTTDGLAGRGNWFWTANTTLEIYEVGSGGIASATFSVPFFGLVQPASSTSALAILDVDGAEIGIVDIAGATPTRTDYITAPGRLSAFDAVSTADWIFGTTAGVLRGEVPPAGSPQLYSSGGGIVVASSGRIVVATADGFIRYYDAGTLSLEGTIEYQHPLENMMISADGGILWVDASQNDPREARIYELPSGNLLHQRSYASTVLVNAWLSDSGTAVGETFYVPISTTRYLISDLAGAPVFDTTESGDPRSSVRVLKLSPAGTRSAISSSRDSPDRVDITTDIREGATLIGAAPGLSVGWFTDDRLLVNRYEHRGSLGSAFYRDAEVISSSGEVVATLAIPELRRFQNVGTNHIYSPEKNRIYDMINGAVLWASGSSTTGAAATANHVVLIQDSAVRLQPR